MDLEPLKRINPKATTKSYQASEISEVSNKLYEKGSIVF